MFLKVSKNSQACKTCNFIKKETPTQVFSCEFCEIFKNTIFIEHLSGVCFCTLNFINEETRALSVWIHLVISWTTNDVGYWTYTKLSLWHLHKTWSEQTKDVQTASNMSYERLISSLFWNFWIFTMNGLLICKWTRLVEKGGY